MQKISQPIALTGTANTRDLGGYRTLSGSVLKKKAFLRSDALHNLTPEDGMLLSGYGVACILDLRFPEERQLYPDRLELLPPSVQYVPVSLQEPVKGNRYRSEFPPTMWELYEWMLDDSGVEFRKIFETAARFPDQCVLFHCTGGKDRTGLVAMLLLKLCGVDDETIIGDYALTETVMKDLFVRQTKALENRGFTVPPHIMQSSPENMEKTLRHLAEHYGTADEYLMRIGISHNTIRILREKLLP